MIVETDTTNAMTGLTFTKINEPLKFWSLESYATFLSPPFQNKKKKTGTIYHIFYLNLFNNE